MSKKVRNITLTVLLILIIIATIISVSYAFYQSSVNKNQNIVTTVNIPTCASISLNNSTAIALSGDYAIPVKDSALLNSSDEVLANYKFTFTLNNSCSCDGNLSLAFSPSASSTMPIEAVKYAIVESGTKPSAGAFISDSPFGVSDSLKNDIKQESGVTIAGGYSLSPVVQVPNSQEKNFDIYLWIDYYEGDRTQTNKNNNTTMNKSLEGVVYITNITGDGCDFASETASVNNENNTPKAETVKLNSFVTSLAGTTIDFTDNGEKYSGAVVNENGIRYEGENPNNFVSFNGELWRIIGVFDSDTTGYSESLVKIVKYRSIGWTDFNLAKDSNWNDNLLLNNLNNKYYNNSSWALYPSSDYSTTPYDGNGLRTDETRNMIQAVRWKTGAAESVNSVLTPASLYAFERGDQVPSGSSATPITDNAWPVGLIYPSDYGYAALASSCPRTTSLQSYDSIAECHSKNWLYREANIPTLGSSITETGHVFMIYESGKGDWGDTNFSTTVYPALYLKADVLVESGGNGNGTVFNPYIIM